MTSDARQITAALRGKWLRSYGIAKCPAHHDRTPSLSLTNASDGRLLLRCHAGCTFTDIVAALGSIGLGDVGHGQLDPAEIARREAEEQAELQRRSRQAQALWDGAQPIHATIAEAYLRCRGITCGLPETLRFAPDCWHQSAKRLPAMVALVEGSEGFGVHRTYLRADGRAKGDVAPSKAMLGTVKGGAVRLTAGSGPLVVAEGIETGLSLASGLLKGAPTIWAALSAGNMAALRLPPVAGPLLVATDGDEAGKAGGDKLAERADRHGWKVSLLPAPEGRDWNDVLTAKEAAA